MSGPERRPEIREARTQDGEVDLIDVHAFGAFGRKTDWMKRGEPYCVAATNETFAMVCDQSLRECSTASAAWALPVGRRCILWMFRPDLDGQRMSWRVPEPIEEGEGDRQKQPGGEWPRGLG